MAEAMLAFEQVDVFYGPVQALKQVSLTVAEGNRGADWGQRCGKIHAADVDFWSAAHCQR